MTADTFLQAWLEAGAAGVSRMSGMKNSKLPVGWLALGAFVWGASKAWLNYKETAHHGCPMCLESAFLHSTNPVRLVQHVVTGPLVEEATFRGGLQRHIGLGPASVAFGVAHMEPGKDMKSTVARVLDATIGGLVYGKAYESGGLIASTLVHGAHNLGANLGVLAGVLEDLKTPTS